MLVSPSILLYSLLLMAPHPGLAQGSCQGVKRNVDECSSQYNYARELYCVAKQNSLLNLLNCVTDQFTLMSDSPFCRPPAVNAADGTNDGAIDDRRIPDSGDLVCVTPRDVLLARSEGPCVRCGLTAALTRCPMYDPSFTDCVCQYFRATEETFQCLSSCFMPDPLQSFCTSTFPKLIRRGENVQGPKLSLVDPDTNDNITLQKRQGVIAEFQNEDSYDYSLLLPSEYLYDDDESKSAAEQYSPEPLYYEQKVSESIIERCYVDAYGINVDCYYYEISVESSYQTVSNYNAEFNTATTYSEAPPTSTSVYVPATLPPVQTSTTSPTGTSASGTAISSNGTMVQYSSTTSPTGTSASGIAISSAGTIVQYSFNLSWSVGVLCLAYLF